MTRQIQQSPALITMHSIYEVIQRPPLTLLLILGAMIFIFLGSFWATPEFSEHREPSTIETAGRDFAMYWAAWQIFVSGDPLYSMETAREYRSDPVNQKDMLINPPWCLWLIAPVAWLPYPLALKAWLALNFLLIPAIVLVCLKLFRLPLPKPIHLFFLCIFAPVMSCWYFGQLSIGLTAITCLLLLSMQRKWDWIAGLCLAVMTIKPHIYFLLAFTVGLYALSRYRWRIFAGFIISFLVLLCPFLIKGTSIADWIQQLLTGQPATFMTPTIGTFVRMLLPANGSLPPEWPLTVIPLLALLACAIWFFTHRRSEISWQSTSIPLIALSLLAAPYVWAYDFSLLFIWHVMMIAALQTRGWNYPALAVAITLLFLGQVAFLTGDMHYLIWFPIITMTSWWFGRAEIIDSV